MNIGKDNSRASPLLSESTSDSSSDLMPFYLRSRMILERRKLTSVFLLFLFLFLALLELWGNLVFIICHPFPPTGRVLMFVRSICKISRVLLFILFLQLYASRVNS